MKKSQQSNNITKEDAFIHLVYEYRCLANSAYAWKRFGDPKSNDKAKNDANNLIPEIGTAIQDSLLLHTRTLIEFFWPNSSRPTDININHFIAVNSSNYTQLIGLKRPIEVHVLHLTNWRDPQYRQNKGVNIQRPDWNNENGKIFNWLNEALKELASSVSPPWDKALNSLHDAAKQRFDNGSSYDWPTNLGEENDIRKYLRNL